MRKTFVDFCVAGKTRPEEIDDFVDKWHESNCEVSISEFLGFTLAEYATWVERPETLGQIIAARRNTESSDRLQGGKGVIIFKKEARDATGSVG